MNDSHNWVKNRALRQRRLATGSAALWNEVRSAIQDACESYKEHYCVRGNMIDCKVENGKRIRIERTTTPGTPAFSMLVMFHDTPAIEAIGPNADGDPRIFFMGADDSSVFLTDSKRERHLTVEEASQLILRPILFREDEQLDPVFKTAE